MRGRYSLSCQNTLLMFQLVFGSIRPCAAFTVFIFLSFPRGYKIFKVKSFLLIPLAFPQSALLVSSRNSTNACCMKKVSGSKEDMKSRMKRH